MKTLTLTIAMLASVLAGSIAAQAAPTHSHFNGEKFFAQQMDRSGE